MSAHGSNPYKVTRRGVTEWRLTFTYWQDADTGNLYTMTPTRTYRNARGQDCRDYTIWGWVDGYEENLDGTACRSAAGGWQLPA